MGSRKLSRLVVNPETLVLDSVEVRRRSASPYWDPRSVSRSGDLSLGERERRSSVRRSS